MNLRPTLPIQAATAFAVVLLLGTGAGAWTLDLADSVSVRGTTVRLADLAGGTIPTAAQDLVVVAGGRPGATTAVTARTLLRKLVMAGLAEDVVLRGAARCHIRFDGRPVAPNLLTAKVRGALLPQVPAAAADAPPSWLELEVPAVDLMAGGDWSVEWPRPRALTPGRNLITVHVVDGERHYRLSVVAVLHAYGRVATTTSGVPSC